MKILLAYDSSLDIPFVRSLQFLSSVVQYLSSYIINLSNNKLLHVKLNQSKLRKGFAMCKLGTETINCISNVLVIFLNVPIFKISSSWSQKVRTIWLRVCRSPALTPRAWATLSGSWHHQQTWQHQAAFPFWGHSSSQCPHMRLH